MRIISSLLVLTIISCVQASHLKWYQMGWDCTNRKAESACIQTNCSCMWCNIYAPFGEEWKCGAIEYPVPLNCQSFSSCTAERAGVMPTTKKDSLMKETLWVGLCLMIIFVLGIIIQVLKDSIRMKFSAIEISVYAIENYAIQIVIFSFIAGISKIIYNVVLVAIDK